MELNEDSQGPTAIHPLVALPAPLRKGCNYGRKVIYDQEAGTSKCQRFVVPITLPVPRSRGFQMPEACGTYYPPHLRGLPFALAPALSSLLGLSHLCPFIQWTTALTHSVTHSFFHPPEDFGGQGLLYDHPHHTTLPDSS